jgi:dolichol-phosphate mannosyltransferase
VIHQPNSGHGRALRTGLDEARHEYVLLIDSDRQIPLAAFHTLWEAAQRHDGAFGFRRNRHDPWIRLLLTSIVRQALTLLFNVRLHDANVPFKVLRRSIWLQARELIPEETLAPSIFLAIVARRSHDIVEIEVPHRERITGLASIRAGKLFKFCAHGFAQLCAFRMKLKP